MMRSILGVDHVGIGVRDLDRMTDFYAEVFGMRVIASMPEEDHPAMRGLLRSPRAVHSSRLLGGAEAGMTLALFRAVEPPPRPIRTDRRYGDIGVAKLCFFVSDLHGFCGEHAPLLDLKSPEHVATLDGLGEYRFRHASDPEGNLLELVQAPDPMDYPAALSSVGVAVTDLERSLDFYRGVIGLDKLVVPPHEAFSERVDEVTGCSGAKARSCLLGSTRGRGMLELVEMVKPRGRSIPFGTQWGDFGYLQLCLYAGDAQRLAADVVQERLDVLLPLQTIDDPDFPAQFMYLRDPDGVPVEVLGYPPGSAPGA